MTDTTSTLPPPPNQKAPVTPARKAKPASLWPLFLCFIILAALGTVASVYFWQTLTQVQKELHTTTEANKELKGRLGQIGNNIDLRIRDLAQQNASQDELLNTLDKLALFNTTELNRLHASNRVDWLLAEAEYLLRLANQRLNIENDILGAENILIAADKVLAEADDPSLYPVRKALSKEILALQSVKRLDIDGAYLKIQSVISALDKIDESSFLGAKTDKTAEQADALLPKEAQTVWQDMWQDLRKAVLIRRLDEPVKPLLAPEQSYYLKQNLQLMLEQAALALLKQDQFAYSNNLNKALSWVNQYFSFTSDQTRAISNTLKQLAPLKVTREKPDISESNKLLKARIEVMYRQHQLQRIQPEDAPDTPIKNMPTEQPAAPLNKTNNKSDEGLTTS